MLDVVNESFKFNMFYKCGKNEITYYCFMNKMCLLVYFYYYDMLTCYNINYVQLIIEGNDINNKLKNKDKQNIYSSNDNYSKYKKTHTQMFTNKTMLMK